MATAAPGGEDGRAPPGAPGRSSRAGSALPAPADRLRFGVALVGAPDAADRLEEQPGATADGVDEDRRHRQRHGDHRPHRVHQASCASPPRPAADDRSRDRSAFADTLASLYGSLLGHGLDAEFPLLPATVTRVDLDPTSTADDRPLGELVPGDPTATRWS